MWAAFDAITEYLDFGRRYAARTNQMQRSFEDTVRKQRARSGASRITTMSLLPRVNRYERDG